MIHLLFPLLIQAMTGLFHSQPAYYEMGDFLKVKKIDTHTHHNSESTALAEAAISSNFFLLDVNVDAPGYPDISEQLRLAVHQKSKNPDHLDFLSTISLEGWNDPNWAEKEISRIENSLEQGALGIKIWKNIGMTYKDENGNFIMADHPRLEPIFQFLLEKDKTLMAHLGEPKNCWLPLEEMTVNNDRSYFKEHPEYHMYLHPEYPSYEQQIEARDNLLSKFPEIRFVGAHLGSVEWDVDELARRLDRFPNMAVDMAARIGHLQFQSQKDRQRVRDFMIRYQDRLIYGTDLAIAQNSDDAVVKERAKKTWEQDWKYFATEEWMEDPVVNGSFQGLQLPKEVIDKIYFHNAVKWFKIQLD
ncbi:amidohydrolase family protein [Algoriphagus sp. CAU 1675]|uniref:amidohydrolase family protein n=1 Tax=Algoriphagus sp. CAU 1675 TaxID=3032597 RepID=UPI0023DBFA65|nr:amidohydrolase family protein [Algoriphagus sp. CAU 1675]MDF2158414.1 amidohydrolase family protein [Algoriphagus sp. CAU 1675]